MRDAALICTRNRPQELELCLESVLSQEHVPMVTVVDASDGDESREIVTRYQSMRYLTSVAGLTRQRNLGVNALAADIDVVHFIDDDVVLEPGYFAALNREFENPAVDGVGGVITNVVRGRPSYLARAFLQDSVTGGRLLRSARNILPGGFAHPTRVDWLSGCSMSFRRRIVEATPFPEEVGIGEDVEYALRLGRDVVLVATPEARLEHRQSSVNRLSALGWTRHFIHLRYEWVRRYPDRFSRLAFWWAAAGECLAAAFRAATHPHDEASRAILVNCVRAYASVGRPDVEAEGDPWLPAIAEAGE